LHKQFGFQRVNNVKPNDILLFKNSATAAGHIGVVLDDSSFLHMSHQGAGIANYLYGVWQRQIHSVYRYQQD
jgi:NlpC/P60 family.